MIPPITTTWLRSNDACVEGTERFLRAAMGNALYIHDESNERKAVNRLARYCITSDLLWALRRLVGKQNAMKIFDESVRLINLNGGEYLLGSYSSRDKLICLLSAAFVAAWKEYHR
jgi:hypothetical protein